MKELIYKDLGSDPVKLFYEINYYECGDYGTYPCATTDFYFTNNKTRKVKKYWLFGPLIDVPDNELVFTIPFNIESVDRGKNEIRASIKKKLDLIKRAEEIKLGEII